MKSLELTEEHKTKLLEMCHTLFPEMDAHTIQCTEESNGMILGTWGQSTDGIAIHWLEFVLRFLVDRIIDNEALTEWYGRELDQAKGYFLIGDDNPIDELYEHFKNIENEEV